MGPTIKNSPLTLSLTIALLFLTTITTPKANAQLPTLPLPALPLSLPLPPLNANINAIVINTTLTCSPTLTGLGQPLANTTVIVRLNGTVLANVSTNANGSISVSIPINLSNLSSLNTLSVSLPVPIVGCSLTTSLNPGTILQLPPMFVSFVSNVVSFMLPGLPVPLIS